MGVPTSMLVVCGYRYRILPVGDVDNRRYPRRALSHSLPLFHECGDEGGDGDDACAFLTLPANDVPFVLREAIWVILRQLPRKRIAPPIVFPVQERAFPIGMRRLLHLQVQWPMKIAILSATLFDAQSRFAGKGRTWSSPPFSRSWKFSISNSYCMDPYSSTWISLSLFNGL